MLFSYPCFAQTSKVNALQQQLKKPMPDTTRLRVLAELCSAYTSVDPVKKMDYARQCKALAEKLHKGDAVADAYTDMGISCGIRGVLDSSIYYFKAGYAESQKAGYLKGMGKNLMDMGYAVALRMFGPLPKDVRTKVQEWYKESLDEVKQAIKDGDLPATTNPAHRPIATPTAPTFSARLSLMPSPTTSGR